MHRAVGQDELHVGAAGAALLPGLELEGGQIRDEIRLPHVAPRPNRDEVTLALEIALLALAIMELEAVVEDESGVVEQVQHDRQVCGGRQARPFLSAAVEVLIAAVERQGEEAVRPPLEAMAPPVVGFDHGVAVAGQDVDDLFEEVALRLGAAARSQVQDQDRDEVAASL